MIKTRIRTLPFIFIFLVIGITNVHSIKKSHKTHVNQDIKKDVPVATIQKQSKEQANLKKEEISQAKHQQKSKYLYEFQIDSQNNSYVIPVTIQQKKYNLGIIYQQKGSNLSDTASWIFTSLTQNHELCLQSQCQDVKKYLQCEDKHATNAQCVESGKYVLKTGPLISRKKANVSFSNNNNKYNMQFVSPSKVTLPGLSQIQNLIGCINLAVENKEYQNDLILSGNLLKIAKQNVIDDEFTASNEGIDFTTKKLLQFGQKKDIYLTTKNVKNGNITNDIKLTFEKIKLNFGFTNTSMSMPKNMFTAVKNIIKKQYFGDRCKDNNSLIICSASPVRNITTIMLCRQSKANKCIQLPIHKLIVNEVKKNKVYTFAIQENKNQQNSITFHPSIGQFYTIYTNKGIVKGVTKLGKSQPQKQQVKDQQQKKQEQRNQKQGKQKQRKQEQRKEEQRKKKQSKQKQKQEQKQEQKQKQSKQEQSGGQVKAEEAKQKGNEKQKEPTLQKSPLVKQKHKKQQKSQKDEQESNDDSDSQSKSHSSRLQKKSKQRRKEQRQKHQSKQSKQSTISGQEQQQKTYSRGLLFFFLIYGGVFIFILIVVKIKAPQSLAASAIDRCIDITWYGIVKSYFTKRQGYSTPQLQQGNEEIDHSDSVTMGYTQKQGRDLFWEKNSVQGI